MPVIEILILIVIFYFFIRLIRNKVLKIYQYNEIYNSLNVDKADKIEMQYDENISKPEPESKKASWWLKFKTKRALKNLEKDVKKIKKAEEKHMRESQNIHYMIKKGMFSPFDRIVIIFIVLLLVGCFLADRLYFNRYEIIGAGSGTAYRIDKITGQYEVYHNKWHGKFTDPPILSR